MSCFVLNFAKFKTNSTNNISCNSNIENKISEETNLLVDDFFDCVVKFGISAFHIGKDVIEFTVENIQDSVKRLEN